MSEEFIETVCAGCGVVFGFSKKVEEVWRRNEKVFFCPNGHPLSWPKQKETPEQKEVKTLRAEVQDLQSKLKAALEDAAKQTKRANELAAELEIWKPSTASEASAE